ncbi:MAG: 2-oxo acid dehydrogenase subunit E2 [Pseudomonadota bacterium]
MPELKTSPGRSERKYPNARADRKGVVCASPAARHHAARLGVDLTPLKGSGPNGRIILRDIDDHADLLRSAGVSPGPSSANPSQSAGRRGISQVIQAWPTRPVLAQANLTAKCRLDELLEARRQHNLGQLSPQQSSSAARSGVKTISLSSLFVKALAKALAEVPAANVVLSGDRLIQQNHCDIAFARSSMNGRVDFPTITDADQKTPWDISKELDAIQTGGRTVRGEEDGPEASVNQGRQPTAAIANLGRGAVSGYQTPLSPSHATVIAIPAATPRLVPPASFTAGSGKLPPAESWTCVMSLEITLGCDTRMLSGVIAADLLETFIAHLENPKTLIPST